ncbi:MAG: T9SS sorting signal type C domain-containing protein [Flavobacteriales bacterium]
MKKVLLPVLILSTVAISAQSGIYVASGGNVHVQPQTLVYSKGGLNVGVADGKVVSDGHIKLDGEFKNAGDGTNVTFVYTDANKNIAYGQLQIAEGVTSTGKATFMTHALASQKDLIMPGIAFPFVDTDLVEALKNSSFGTKASGIGTTSRYTNYAWWFNNDDYNVEAPAAKPSGLQAKAFSLNLQYGGFSPKVTNDNLERFKIAGVPFSGTISETIKPSLTQYTDLDESWETSKYGELYKDLVSDFASNLTDADWGHNIYAFGNPYTENIDIYTLLNQSSITPSLVKAFAVPVGTSGSAANSGIVNMNVIGKYIKFTCANTTDPFSSSTCTGNQFNVIRPFYMFNLKLNSFTGEKTLKFDDRIKTFSYTNLIVPESYTGTDGTQNTSRMAPKSASYSKSSSVNYVSSSQQAIEELKLTLTANGSKKGEVFLAANPWATEEADTDVDIVSWLETATSLVDKMYLVEENADASVNLSGKRLDINGFNKTSYVGKPLPVVVFTTTGNQYSIKGNVRIADDNNLNNSNYYLEDKRTKKIVRVGSDFDYGFTASSDDTGRFIVYYGKAPVDVDNEVVEEITNRVIDVAKDASGESYVVFKGMTGKAKIIVYNVLGQLVYTDNNVSTNTNYSLHKLPNNSGVYIVKVIDEKGNTTSKKIIK